MVFAAAPSQNEMLDALATNAEIDWSCVVAFHMDEYLGLDAAHPASFRRYLREHLFDRVGLRVDQLRLIPGERADEALDVCRFYADLLQREPPQILCAGIGENGHLAFNDPPVADFHDPVPIKVVRLDPACRQQQVHDGAFEALDDVPRHAFTLTIPALLAAKEVFVTVVGPRKAEAVRRALTGPIDETCPASALRLHPKAHLFLDTEAASLIG